MSNRAVVAIDFGAESGRVVLGRFDGGRVTLEEVHRFPTPPRPHDGHLRWNLHGLWSQVKTGLAAAGRVAVTVDSVGVDAWGVDYGLLGGDGELLGDPVSYRDRAQGAWSRRHSAGWAPSGSTGTPAPS
jgi:rhamnulokinase